ncbi:hypothetical protein BIY24_05715 [Halobacteriovorax marinus]|uniref:Hpt domain-containing protein n=1 Tax=Halobacteriovorax marinus TaxID=97084 RepID=UPI000BC310D2|nr:Hpt domain-containing protein [Halobacteriovorax marinus]ATH07456.1 hypothetical protein BIY24_05715 [Halobacteriovorax marinus]
MASFDQKLLEENFGDDRDILGELFLVFSEEAPKMMTNISTSISDNDSDSLRLHAHTFKGAVGNFFATDCVETSFELETMGRAGDVDQERAKELYNALESHLEAFSKDFKGYLG